MTRYPTLPLALLALTLLLAGCGGGGGGGDEAPPSILILTTEAKTAGSTAQVVRDFGLGVSHMDTSTGDMFYEIFGDGPAWTPADVGEMRALERGDGPAFALFAEQASNAVDEGLYFKRYLDGDLRGGTAASESTRWAGGFDGTLVPDAAGYVITRVEAELTHAVLDTPANDPNGDGIYTAYDLRWTLRVYGYKAP